MLKTIVKILLPLLILAGAVGGAMALVKSRPKPPKQERQAQAYLVEAMPVQRASHRIDVRAQGTVESSKRLQLQSQVTGKVQSVDEGLVPGGILKKGTTLLRIDATDYRIALEERDTALEEARARLAQEQGQQVIAKRELELFNQSLSTTSTQEGAALDDTSLALREPQLKIAEVAVEAAEARKKRARVDLSRTTVKAPFNALVLSESVELGQLVSPQNTLATLVGTDTFWVRASVPMARLTRIKIPGFNLPAGSDQKGSEVTVEIDAGEVTSQRKGRVIRLLGELDQVGRMAQILIEVEDPLLLSEANAKRGELPLLLGSYVQILFEGSQQMELVEVPRRALRNGSEIWVYNQDDTLDVRQVEIVANFPESVLVSSGIEEGELLITSRIGSPVQGMSLRRAETSGQEAKSMQGEKPQTPDTSSDASKKKKSTEEQGGEQ